MSETQTKTSVSLPTTEDQRKKVIKIQTALANKELKEGSVEYHNLQEEISKLPAETRRKIGNVTWQRNSLLITNGVKEFMQKHGFMPSSLQLASIIGLSHVTVGKHLKELKNTDAFQGELQAFSTQYGSFLGVIGNAALNGDLKAAKMSIDILTNNKPTPTIQVNNTNIDIVLKEVLSLVPKSEQDKVQSLIEAVTTNSETIEVEPTEIEGNEK